MKKLSTTKTGNSSIPKITVSDYIISRCIEKNITGMKALLFDIKK